MTRIFNSASARWSSRVLSVLRIVAALLFIEHGTQKVFGFPPAQGPNAPYVFASLSGIAGALELVGGVALLVGLLTRPVAFLLSGEMAVAYFKVHAPRGFLPLANHGELAALYCFLFLYFSFAGGGPWSVDAIIAGSRRLVSPDRVQMPERRIRPRRAEDRRRKAS
jgi:putative oxidoreductase